MKIKKRKEKKEKNEKGRGGNRPKHRIKIRCPHCKDMAQSTTETMIPKRGQQRNSKFWSTCTDISRQAAIAQYL